MAQESCESHMEDKRLVGLSKILYLPPPSAGDFASRAVGLAENASFFTWDLYL